MGFSNDDFSSMLINGISQFFINMVSSFMRLFGRKPKETLPPAEQVTAMARNPLANKQLASSEPRGVFFGGAW